MKIVLWTDRRGWRHRSLVRDSDPEEAAPSGILQDPPDLREGVDWEAVARDLHNHLVDHGVMTWKDLQKDQSLSAGIQAALRRRVVECFKYAEMTEG